MKQNLKLLSDAKDPLTATLNALKETLQLHIVDIIGRYCSFYSSVQLDIVLCFLVLNHQSEHVNDQLITISCDMEL